MFLEWWMILILLAWWFVSLWDIRQTVFNEGVSTAVDNLIETGYLELADDDEVIGLCNSHKRRTKRPQKARR